jgi:hypothetical protein
MKRPSLMVFIPPWGRRFHYAMGYSGWIALGLLVILAAYHSFGQTELHDQIHQLQKNLLKPTPARIKVIYKEPDLPWKAFPSTVKENALHALFYTEAAKAGVTIPEVHYQKKALPGTPLIAYRIELSTTTTYVSLKKWIAALMSVYPTLVLEHLHLERESVQSDVLKATIQWVWYAMPEGCVKDCTDAHQWNFRNHFPINQTNAFRALNYTPPPAPVVIVQPRVVLPPPPAPPPPKPTAPPLPFKYLGKLGEHHTVQKEEEFIELIPGQVIADQYKVESITEDQAVFIYLPLQEKQTLLLRNE